VRAQILKYYNLKRSKGLIFKRGDIAYLLHKNFIITRPLLKLNYKKLGLFKIEEVILDTNYKLSLPLSIRIYLIFYILLLKKALKITKSQIDIEVYEEEYEPERIIDKQVKDREI
jgi:hypothetical protein